MKLPRWRLFPKYAMLITAVVAGVLVVSGAINLVFSWRETQANLVALQVEKAQGAAVRIEQFMLDIEHEIGWTAFPRTDNSSDAIEQRRIEYLKLQKQAQAITELVWIGTDGRERLRVSRLAMDTVGAGTDFSNDPAFLAVRTSKETWFGPVQFRKDTEPYMAIARPAGGDGGVTLAYVNLKFVWDVVSRIKIGHNGLAYVVDATGTLIAHPDISLVLKKTDMKPLPQVAALERANSGDPVAAHDLAGQQVFTAHARIPALNWTVFVESPRAEALAPLRESIMRLALLLVGGLLLAAAESFVLARALVRPIRALQEGAARIGAGELDQRIQIKTGDELEGLAEQFNKMGSELQASYAGLERKVEERTAELSIALNQQTAIADVMRVMSASVADSSRAFNAIVSSAEGLFAGAQVGIELIRDDGQLELAAHSQGMDAGLLREYPKPLANTPTEQAIRDRAARHIDDILHDDDYRAAHPDADPNSSYAIGLAPMLWEGRGIGAVFITQSPPRAFTRQQLLLLRTFADQAVIAIQNARLFNETKEALQRQTATAEILRVISGSPTNVQPVLDTVAERSGALCRAEGSRVWLLQGGKLCAMTSYGSVYVDDEREALPLGRGSIAARAFVDRTLVHVEDVVPLIDTEYPDVRQLQARYGFRTVLAVPMLREGESVGVISLLRNEVRPFSTAEIALVHAFADQAVIAIENVRLFNETKEALEQQTATAEVLQVISGSVADARPVFEKIVKSCQRLFDGDMVGLQLLGDDGFLRLAAYGGPGRDRLEGMYPLPLAGSSAEQGFVERRVVHTPDALHGANVAPTLRRTAESMRANFSHLQAPMLWEGRGVGSIFVSRAPPVPFTDQQVELLRTFADQAVIAIQNARLFNETKEALERQTATSEVLRVISESPADAQPALDAVAERARLLCKAQGGRVWVPDGDRLRSATGYKLDDGSDAGRGEALPIKASSVVGRAFVERRVVQVDDVEALLDSEYPDSREVHQRHRFRSILAVPLLREGIALGVIGLARKDVRPFVAPEIELVQTFADQAVIAIENVRLFNETKESLERQTATAEILKVIASSPTDVQPVFAVIVESAVRLCGARFGRVYRYDGSLIEMVASHGLSTHGLGLVQRVFPRPAAADTIVGRVILARQPYFMNDVEQDASVPALSRQMIEALGTRSQVTIPILRAGDSIGAITMGWAEPAGFDDQRVALLQTFADQAVIAIENVRLFNETKEALEQQTATSEVLRVISSSVADTGPVFDKILHSCSHLFESSEQGIVLLGDDGRLHLGAHRGTARERLAAMFPMVAGDEPVARAMTEQRVLHYPDVLRDAEPGSVSRLVAERLDVGSYTQVFAPMRWEGRGVGYLYVIRSPVAPFSDKEIGLLKTFADQAAIAIQNARLFNEIQNKSRQLEAANRHKSEFLANMSHELRTPLNAIIGFSEVLAEKMFGDVNDKQMEYLQDIHSSGQHLLALINDVLDLSKIEAGKMELDLSCFDLGLLLDHSATLVRERAQRHGLALELEVDDGLAEWVADARKVKQVVVNLLSNAVKFTPNGGRVSVRARHLNGVNGRAGEWAEVSVSDTGVGIAREDQALVFEEFRQAGGDVLRKAEGTGLGLALVKRFVELHGGEVTLDSEPGRGSTFRFTLPQLEVKVLQ